ncbi:MAG: DEAD/DEAH box helicase [Vampirovibrio sp.]|nr:DEAD/DEAH box helicase [Vampirovibrio sp.]
MTSNNSPVATKKAKKPAPAQNKPATATLPNVPNVPNAPKAPNTNKAVPFTALNLSEGVQKAITGMGFETPSPIQADAIPALLDGGDVIGQAQTGTGKTAAFAIPVIERVDAANRRIQAIVLCPTRELAIQVTDEFRKLGKFTPGLVSMAVYGGQPITKQIHFLRRQPQIIVGTPGRVLDLIRRGTLKLGHVKMAVLDEADEMLNMGFRPDIETILSHTPAQNRQTILFSATMPRAILELTAKFQRNAKHIKVKQHDQPVAQVDQRYLKVQRRDKSDTLFRLLNEHKFQRSLVFCNTKRQVDYMVTLMRGKGYAVDGLHGGKTQSQRDRIMQGYRRGKTQILIATDVAARGLDVNDIEAVFNYDLPKEA